MVGRAMQLLVISGLLGASTIAGACNIPESRRATLDSLLRAMLYSVGDPYRDPNPSVLIALRLARDHHLETETRLIEQLREEAAQKLDRREDFSSGLLALYTLAFTAACHNPEHLQVQGKTFKLLRILEEKLNEEIKHIESYSVPLSNNYQVSLDVLSLCVHHHPLTADMVRVLTDAVEGDRFTHGGNYSVDTGAVAALAMWCVSDRFPALSGSIVSHSLRGLVRRLVSAVRPDGLIGNVYSTGLAAQALSVTHSLVPPGSWNCSQTLQRLLLSAEDVSLHNPQAASQVTPSLEGRTYLDVGAMDCRADRSNLTLPELTSSAAPVTSPATIRVWYNVTDGLGGTFTDKVLVTVPRGSTLLRVMEVSRDLHPLRFSFQYKITLWGPSLSSVRGLAASSEDRTYWSLRSGSRPLEQGIGDYVPSDGETIVVILSRY